MLCAEVELSERRPATIDNGAQKRIWPGSRNFAAASSGVQTKDVPGFWGRIAGDSAEESALLQIGTQSAVRLVDHVGSQILQSTRRLSVSVAVMVECVPDNGDVPL